MGRMMGKEMQFIDVLHDPEAKFLRILFGEIIEKGFELSKL
ncbi:MAG: hypothetical protein JWM11_7673 [Planctomycetaceae bacterium]|nr:hypothetical protein [Planctomycetaceae bacterium]